VHPQHPGSIYRLSTTNRLSRWAQVIVLGNFADQYRKRARSWLLKRTKRSEQ
jgi:hypothetical protein